MKTSFALPMGSSLLDFLRSWVLSGLSLVARCGFLLALVAGFTAQPVGAAEPTNSVLHFDGNGSYLELPPHSLDGYKAITVEAWVRPERLGFWTRLFDFGTWKDSVAASFNGGFTVEERNAGTMAYGHMHPFGSRYETIGWIHIAVVFERNGFRAFLNGDRVLQSEVIHKSAIAGDGNCYYFGRSAAGGVAGVSIEEDYGGQMDEIRIWDKALSPDEIKAGLSRRGNWGANNLVVLVNSDTNRVKAIDGQESSAILRGDLAWKNQGRSQLELTRRIKTQSVEIVFPSEIRSLNNTGIKSVNIENGITYGNPFSNYYIKPTTNTIGRLSADLSVSWFPDQSATKILMYAWSPSGLLAASHPLNITPSGLSARTVELAHADTNVLRRLLANPLTGAIRQARDVGANMDLLFAIGLEEDAVEALIDAAVAGGYQSYPARFLLGLEVIPKRLAKFFQVRQSVSARFLGGCVAALGLVMSCLWIFNRGMAFALWFGCACLPISLWLLWGGATDWFNLRLSITFGLVPLMFYLTRSALHQGIPFRCSIAIAALLPALGVKTCAVLYSLLGAENSFPEIPFIGTSLNLAAVALVWILVETIISFTHTNTSASALQRRLVLWTWISALIICLGIPNTRTTFFAFAQDAVIIGELCRFFVYIQQILVSFIPTPAGSNPDLAWEYVQVPAVISFALSGFCLLGNRFRELRLSLEASNSMALQQLEEIKLKSEALQIAQVAAEAASKAKSQFLANMSHELRTPLNAIIGYSEMLQEEADDLGTPEIKPDLQKIHGAGKHLLGLINDILDLSKIEAGKMTLYLETFEVQTLLNEVAATVQPMINKNGNQLTLEVAPEIGSMRADVTKVRQALFNLLSNASKFTDKGSITLRARRQGADLVFEVIDSGIGMTPDQVGRLFQAFAQADASTSKKYGGTGLGLALSRKFCQLMGGDLTVTSEYGKGSTFTATIPALVLEVAEEYTPTASVPTVGTLSKGFGPLVLVIDDDATVQDLLRRSLNRDGFRVETAADGATGLARARELRPAIITLDVMMPGMDGWEVLAALKEDPETADIPVIVVSIVDERGLGFSLGAADYLTKPLDFSRLSSVLNRHAKVGLGRRVLIVEDDEATQELLQKRLTKEGWQVVAASNGREALERLTQGPPDLVLLDLMMPEMDGFEFLEAFRKQPGCAQVTVVVMTAKILTPADHQRLRGQVSQVVAKTNLSPEMLAAEIRSVLGKTLPNP